MTANLPSFKKPPLTEVYLSIQFAPLQGLDIPQLGACWHLFKERFPKYERHEQLARTIEREGIKNIASSLNLALQIITPIPRLWFINEDGKELVQIQNDRFIRNWRKIHEDNIYPRYENHIRPKFIEDFLLFKGFLEKERIGGISIDQCEISYINHIKPNKYWKSHDQLDQVFNIWSGKKNKISGLSFEDANINARFKILDNKSEFLGRLHINIQPVFSKEGSPIFLLTISSRGCPLNKSDEGILEFMNKGREHIVNTFAEITTTHMHEIWEREL
jgi:uncharacterized protein (TIGR04255 family)